MDEHYKIVGGFLGLAETLYGCKKCGIVVWNREVHTDVMHCGLEDAD